MSKQVSVAVGGDIFANSQFYADDRPISPTFDDVLAITGDADIVFANYEMPLSTRGQPAEKLANIRADPMIAGDIGRLGLDIVSIANNHMMDYGPEALADTIACLDEQGIAHVGAGPTLARAVEPVIVDVRGRKIGFLAFTCLVAPGAGATDSGPGVAPLHVQSAYEVNPYWQAEEPGEPAMVTIRTFADAGEQALAEECVRALCNEVDTLCLSLHWGYGGLSSRIAEYQRPLGYAMIDAGADIILGNHVHAVQGVEWYRGKAILYSPGTFVGRQLPPESEGGEITDLVRSLLADMSPDGFLTVIELDDSGGYDLRMIPTSLDGNGLPVIAVGDVLDRIAQRVIEWSAKFGARVELVDGELRSARPTDSGQS
jgi:poly-gamma-glutamate capsule biosynthesis protein CapA/YwtB (metallophosphatase superfamily)